MDFNELERKSFDFWFSSNERCGLTPTTEEEKGLLNLGYHFGFQNCLKLMKESLVKELYSDNPDGEVCAKIMNILDDVE
ncbi:MAG: hypothetical protein MJ181_10745 [Treponema sp.]|nr:hypothetical protein [Treponema sp.]